MADRDDDARLRQPAHRVEGPGQLGGQRDHRQVARADLDEASDVLGLRSPQRRGPVCAAVQGREPGTLEVHAGQHPLRAQGRQGRQLRRERVDLVRDEGGHHRGRARTGVGRGRRACRGRAGLDGVSAAAVAVHVHAAGSEEGVAEVVDGAVGARRVPGPDGHHPALGQGDPAGAAEALAVMDAVRAQHRRGRGGLRRLLGARPVRDRGGHGCTFRGGRVDGRGALRGPARTAWPPTCGGTPPRARVARRRPRPRGRSHAGAAAGP